MDRTVERVAFLHTKLTDIEFDYIEQVDISSVSFDRTTAYDHSGDVLQILLQYERLEAAILVGDSHSPSVTFEFGDTERYLWAVYARLQLHS